MPNRLIGSWRFDGIGLSGRVTISIAQSLDTSGFKVIEDSHSDRTVSIGHCVEIIAIRWFVSVFKSGSCVLLTGHTSCVLIAILEGYETIRGIVFVREGVASRVGYLRN